MPWWAWLLIAYALVLLFTLGLFWLVKRSDELMRSQTMMFHPHTKDQHRRELKLENEQGVRVSPNQYVESDVEFLRRVAKQYWLPEHDHDRLLKLADVIEDECERIRGLTAKPERNL